MIIKCLLLTYLNANVTNNAPTFFLSVVSSRLVLTLLSLTLSSSGVTREKEEKHCDLAYPSPTEPVLNPRKIYVWHIVIYFMKLFLRRGVITFSLYIDLCA